MDIEQGLRAHLVDRAGAPIPADLTARLASRVEPRRRAGRRASGRKAAVALGSLAAVLVAAFVMYEVATVDAHPLRACRRDRVVEPVAGAIVISLPDAARAPVRGRGRDLSLPIASSGSLPVSASTRAMQQPTKFVLYRDGTAVFDVPVVRIRGVPGPERPRAVHRAPRR